MAPNARRAAAAAQRRRRLLVPTACATALAVARVPLAAAQPITRGRRLDVSQQVFDEAVADAFQPDPQKYHVPVDSPGRGTTLSLYPAAGAVGVESGESLARKLRDPVVGGQRWFFVELYDHMCPHCWYAVPIVTSVAKAFAGEDKFRPVSLNCHVHENLEACFFLEVVSGAQGFPTFLLCPPTDVEPEIPLAELSTKAQHLATQLADETRKTLLSFARCHVRFIENTVKGKEDPFLSALEVAQWITGATGLTPRTPEDLERGVDFTGTVVPNPASPPGRPGWLSDDEPGRPGVPAWVPGQRWFDAGRGLMHVLYHGYRADRHQDVVDCLQFLARTLPFKGHEVASLAEELAALGPQDDLIQARAAIDRWARLTGLPSPTDADGDEQTLRYTTCKDSTCAMWTLLHIVLSAIASRGITGGPLLADGAFTGSFKGQKRAAMPSIHSSMSFVRLFVRTFLNCKRCKDNFLEDFDLCEYGRCKTKDYKALALWLWRSHNAISMRVASRYHYTTVDRRWPMYEDCPSCWNRDLVLNGNRTPSQAKAVAETGRHLDHTWSQDELEAPFQTDQVFWHLLRTYVGLSHVELREEDLTKGELAHVKAVLEEDRRKEQLSFAAHGGLKRGFVEPPPQPRKRPSSQRPLSKPTPPPPPRRPEPLPVPVPAHVERSSLLRPAAPGLPVGREAELARQEALVAVRLGEHMQDRGRLATFLVALVFIAALAILTCWVLGIAWFEGGDVEVGLDGSVRAPVLRMPGSHSAASAQDDDDDDDLVSDAQRKAAVRELPDDEDPAAE